MVFSWRIWNEVHPRAYARGVLWYGVNAEQERPLPFTYLCSVVSAELYAGALDSSGIRLVRHFVSRSERVGRVVTPTHGSWNDAGRILAKIGREEPEFKSKFSILFNDILIALCALQIGATICTNDEEDFRLIRRYKRFDLEVIGSKRDN